MTPEQSKYIEIRRMIRTIRPDITSKQIDAMVRANLPENPTPVQWVTQIQALHALVLSAYNHPVEEEVYVDLPSVEDYFGLPVVE